MVKMRESRNGIKGMETQGNLKGNRESKIHRWKEPQMKLLSKDRTRIQVGTIQGKGKRVRNIFMFLLYCP